MKINLLLCIGMWISFLLVAIIIIWCCVDDNFAIIIKYFLFLWIVTATIDNIKYTLKIFKAQKENYK